jgi:hypothetical protein
MWKEQRMVEKISLLPFDPSASLENEERIALCVVGMALGDMDLSFAWQAWHL